MNLTVGPLPPAVYWRRRAMVAGGLLLLVLLIAYSCGGSSGSGAPSQRTGATAHTPDPTLSEFRPQTSSPGPQETGSPTASPTSGAEPTATGSATGSTTPAAGSDLCTDAEIQLTPSVQRITGGSSAYQLTLKIKNVSDRTCKRDIGSNPQEMHIVSNGQTVWSSDSCQGGPGQNNVATFGPGIEDAFHVAWDGSGGSNCTNPDKLLPPGTYQLVAKLDTKVSDPVPFTIPGK